MIDEGGVVALVGPTGVGKTTTVAKLAARFALKHGKRRLALVSLDNFRIGAHEQLLTFGRILGVPVHFAGDADGLRRYLDQLSDKALVLVDTAGVGQRDERLYEQLAPLAGIGEDVRVLLTLAANTERRALADVVARFAPLHAERDRAHEARRGREPGRRAVAAHAGARAARLRDGRAARAGGHPFRAQPPARARHARPCARAGGRRRGFRARAGRGGAALCVTRLPIRRADCAACSSP